MAASSDFLQKLVDRIPVLGLARSQRWAGEAPTKRSLGGTEASGACHATSAVAALGHVDGVGGHLG